MAIEHDGVAKVRPLDALGISESEEHVYRWLLDHAGASAAEAARALPLTSRKAQQLLDAIEGKGLVTYSPERPRRYVPTSPDIALQAIVLRRQADLQRAQGTIRELQEHVAARHQGEQEQLVELITSREVESRLFEQTLQAAQHEVIVLVRPPLRIPQDDETQREAQARGVRFRGVVDAEFLALPGAMESVRNDLKSGQEIRVLPHLPFKLALVDRRLAFVPLNLDQQYGPSLLVRSSALLDALYALFKMLWERACPLTFADSEKSKPSGFAAQLPKNAEDLVTLLAAGLNDKATAHELDVSLRTLQRYIAELMQTLEARTRFQLGWFAALRLSGNGSHI